MPIFVKKDLQMARDKENKVENTRISYTANAIERDFAEHLKYTQDADVFHTTMQGRYDALAYAIRDRIIHQWDISRKTQQAAKAKRVYYLSLEFLMGRAMTNNITNMGLQDEVSKAKDNVQNIAGNSNVNTNAIKTAEERKAAVSTNLLKSLFLRADGTSGK